MKFGKLESVVVSNVLTKPFVPTEPVNGTVTKCEITPDSEPSLQPSLSLSKSKWLKTPSLSKSASQTGLGYSDAIYVGAEKERSLI